MSSFKVMSTKSRLKLGIAVVVIIHIGMFYGFWRVKAGQIGNKVYEMDIYAAKAAEGLAFYEVAPTEECVKVLNEQAPKPGMPIVEEPAVDAIGTDAAKNAATQKESVTKTPPKEIKLAPSLYYANSPSCKSVASVPAGAEKLGADGFVGLELNIDKDGVVKRGEISRSSGFAELDDAALKQATENLSFKPCHKGDAAVGCKQVIKYRWKIQ
jgi:TonB family protein